MTKTLTKRQIAEGLAEAVKAGLIGDVDLFGKFEGGDFDLEDVIISSLIVKKNVVEQDEKESGLRKILNFGHTIGHGIELVTGLYHGECVALGMIPMCSDDVRARLIHILEKLGLQTSVNADPSEVYSAMQHDKKMVDGKVDAVFTDEIGRCEIRRVALEELRPLIDMVVKK